MAYSLSQCLEFERVATNIRGIRFTARIRSIIHGQFVDDTIILWEASPLITEILKMVLNRFLYASRGLTNVFKSHIFTWNTFSHKQRKIRDVLGYKVIGDWKEFKYVGLPI